jgi:hypothetical protein
MDIVWKIEKSKSTLLDLVKSQGAAGMAALAQAAAAVTTEGKAVRRGVTGVEALTGINPSDLKNAI